MANPRSLRQLKLVYYTLREEGRGHWIVNYAGTKSSQNIISRSLASKPWVLLLNLDRVVQTFSVPTFPSMFLIYGMGTVHYDNWR